MPLYAAVMYNEVERPQTHLPLGRSSTWRRSDRAHLRREGDAWPRVNKHTPRRLSASIVPGGRVGGVCLFRARRAQESQTCLLSSRTTGVLFFREYQTAVLLFPERGFSPLRGVVTIQM